MPGELTRAFLEKVVQGSGWSLAEVEGLSLEGEGISSLQSSFDGLRRLVYLNLARNKLSSLLGVEHLESLATLVLRENRVDSIDEVWRLGGLTNLRELDLRLNPIMTAISRECGLDRGMSGNSSGIGGRPRADVITVLPQLSILDGRGIHENERLQQRRQQQQQKEILSPEQHKCRPGQHYQGRSTLFAATPTTATVDNSSSMGEPDGLMKTTPRVDSIFGRSQSGRDFYNNEFPPEAVAVTAAASRGQQVSHKKREQLASRPPAYRYDGDDGAGDSSLFIPTAASTAVTSANTIAKASSSALDDERRVSMSARRNPPTQARSDGGGGSSRRLRERRQVSGRYDSYDSYDSYHATPEERRENGGAEGRRERNSRELRVETVAAPPPSDNREGRSFFERPATVVVGEARKRDHPSAEDGGSKSSSTRSLSGGTAPVVKGWSSESLVPLVDLSSGGAPAGGHPPRRPEPPPPTALREERRDDDEFAALWRELGTDESLDKPMTSSSLSPSAAASQIRPQTTARTISTSTTAAAAARAVEAFRQSSQRLGLPSEATPTADGCYATGGRRSFATGFHDTDGGDAKGAPPRADVAPPFMVSSARSNSGAGLRDRDCSNKAGESRGSGFCRLKGATNKCGDHSMPAAGSSSEAAVVSLTDVGSDSLETALVATSRKCPACSGEYRGSVQEALAIAAAVGGGAVESAEGAAAAAAAAAAAPANAAEMWNPSHDNNWEEAERWRARERDFEARWTAREKEFDARWAAREREFVLRLRESSKEFTTEMRSMLLGAHEALISSNAWLVERLKAVEAAAVVTADSQPDPEIVATPTSSTDTNALVFHHLPAAAAACRTNRRASISAQCPPFPSHSTVDSTTVFSGSEKTPPGATAAAVGGDAIAAAPPLSGNVATPREAEQGRGGIREAIAGSLGKGSNGGDSVTVAASAPAVEGVALPRSNVAGGCNADFSEVPSFDPEVTISASPSH